MKAACLIPCYNESQRLDRERYKGIFKEDSGIHFYLLNDGSSDDTSRILRELSQGFEHVYVLDFKENRGKAGVIREAMLQLQDSDYDYIGFLDADFATPFEEFQRLLDIAKQKDHDIVFGSRVKLKGWNISRNPIRHWFSRIVLTVIDTLFRLEIYDTQCGCKIFKRTQIFTLFVDPFVTKWLFDIEIFIRYSRSVSVSKIKEIPLNTWSEIKGSKLKISDFLQVPLNILKLYSHYRRNAR